MIVFAKGEGMKRVLVAISVMMLALVGAAHAQYVVGDPIADFTLNDASGTPVSLSDFEGMVVLLNFWEDW